MHTTKSIQYNCSSNQKINNVCDDGTGAYLRLRKDNLAIPKEFYKIDNQDKEDSEFEFESQNQNVKDEMSRIRRKRHPLVPPLNLPKNAVEEWKQKLAIEK
jgi:hypothetical protein